MRTGSFKERLAAVRRALLPGAVVTAKGMAAEIGVSERAIYRYIEALRGLGIEITGEAGVGYQMVKNGNGKPLTQLEIYQTLADSYEVQRQALVARAAEMKDFPETASSLFTAAYVVTALRAGALDVVAKLKGNGQ